MDESKHEPESVKTEGVESDDVKRESELLVAVLSTEDVSGSRLTQAVKRGDVEPSGTMAERLAAVPELEDRTLTSQRRPNEASTPSQEPRPATATGVQPMGADNATASPTFEELETVLPNETLPVHTYSNNVAELHEKLASFEVENRDLKFRLMVMGYKVDEQSTKSCFRMKNRRKVLKAAKKFADRKRDGLHFLCVDDEMLEVVDDQPEGLDRAPGYQACLTWVEFISREDGNPARQRSVYLGQTRT